MEKTPNTFDRIYYPKEYWEWASESIGQSWLLPILFLSDSSFIKIDNYWGYLFQALSIMMLISPLSFWLPKLWGSQNTERVMPSGMNFVGYLFRIVVISSIMSVLTTFSIGIFTSLYKEI
ncbi:hypothetical protein B1R32_11419 [Abditibacterium utsteinense]|uniref:Uncharacterized protein n=1 Tax=Abditibacterium utsteinense TaxID=1960156 RepID=A0A2S8SQW1_9BACT|nr:hypothetical protein [Abditibacterium utsteinense]PQV63194.1 hypothetical protein B1R32_11419 [Abditibacterium utsteinense]